jgi:hypothetical protein
MAAFGTTVLLRLKADLVTCTANMVDMSLIVSDLVNYDCDCRN